MKIVRHLIELLEPNQYRQAIRLFCFILIAMLLETIGIGLIIPVLAVMSRPDAIQQYVIFSPVLTAIGHPSHVSITVFIMLLLVGFYSVKNLFLGYLAWRQPEFAFEVGTTLSQRLFEGYLRQPYVFHLQRNTAQLTHNVTHEVNMVVKYGLISVMNILAESMVLFAIVMLMFYLEPIGTFIVTVFLGFLAWLYQRQIHGKISSWGEIRQYHDGKRVQCVQQGLAGAKETRLLGREQDFFNEYQLSNIEFARAGKLQEMADNMPRLWLEWFAVFSMAILVFMMLIQGRSPPSMVPVLGLFAAAAFRMMPSVSRILAGVQCFSYAIPVIEVLHSEVKMFDNSKKVDSHAGRMSFSHQLEIKELSYSYPGTNFPVLQDINLKISRGDSIGFIGTSGSGKSTLIDIILGLLTPDKGQVLVDGEDIQDFLRAWQNLIGYVSQSIYLTDDTLRRNVAFGLPNHEIDDEAVQRALKAAQLDKFILTLPNSLNTFVGERGIRLSGGQRQRIGIARALYHDPEILVLDEATSSLDTGTETEVMETVRALHGKKTTIIVAHRLSTVAYCDAIFQIEKGQLVEKNIKRN